MVMRALLLLPVIVAGLCTSAMNYRFAVSLGATPFDGQIWGVFAVAIDLIKWYALVVAAWQWPEHRGRSAACVALWLTTVAFSFLTAVGFATHNRQSVTAERKVQLAVQADIELLKASKRWRQTAGCADVTTKASRAFCDTYRELAARVTPIESADAQAEALMKVFGGSAAAASLGLAMLLAAVCEIVSALGIFAFTLAGRAEASARPIFPKPETAEPASPPNEAAVVPWHQRRKAMR